MSKNYWNLLHFNNLTVYVRRNLLELMLAVHEQYEV